jgi:hypothetical protein
MKKQLLGAAATGLALSAVVACSSGKTASEATTTVVRPPALADYAPKVAELAANPRECNGTTMLWEYEQCIPLINEKLSVATQIDPLIRQLPSSPNVEQALRMTQQLISDAAAWNSGRCNVATTVRELLANGCNPTAYSVTTFFGNLAQQVAVLSSK